MNYIYIYIYIYTFLCVCGYVSGNICDIWYSYCYRGECRINSSESLCDVIPGRYIEHFIVNATNGSVVYWSGNNYLKTTF